MFASNGIRDLTECRMPRCWAFSLFSPSDSQIISLVFHIYLVWIDVKEPRHFLSSAFRGSRYLEDFGRLALGIQSPKLRMVSWNLNTFRFGGDCNHFPPNDLLGWKEDV